MLSSVASTVDHQLNQGAVQARQYSSEIVERDGESGYLMTLNVEDPTVRRYYRIAWELPSRRELGEQASGS